MHYVAYGTPGGEYKAGAHRAAIITEVVRALPTEFDDAEYVVLAIFNPTGMHWNKATYSERLEPGTWHWPER